MSHKKASLDNRKSEFLNENNVYIKSSKISREDGKGKHALDLILKPIGSVEFSCSFITSLWFDTG
jgi:hypothetical protein